MLWFTDVTCELEIIVFFLRSFGIREEIAFATFRRIFIYIQTFLVYFHFWFESSHWNIWVAENFQINEYENDWSNSKVDIDRKYVFHCIHFTLKKKCIYFDVALLRCHDTLVQFLWMAGDTRLLTLLNFKWPRASRRTRQNTTHLHTLFFCRSIYSVLWMSESTSNTFSQRS